MCSSDLSSRSNFNDILVGTVYGTGSRCSENIPKMDEILFKNMIDLPNRDPRMLTTSMVIPEIRVKDEERRKIGDLSDFAALQALCRKRRPFYEKIATFRTESRDISDCLAQLKIAINEP